MAQKVLPLNITVEIDAKSNGIYSWLIQMHGWDALVLKQYKDTDTLGYKYIKEGISIQRCHDFVFAHTP